MRTHVAKFASHSSQIIKRLRTFRRSDASFTSSAFHIHQTSRAQELDSVNLNAQIAPFDIYECNLRIKDLGRCQAVEEAWRLFDEMPKRDVFTYTSMMTVYLKNGDLPKAEQIFETVPLRNVVVDSAMVKGYAKAGRIEEARLLFDEMPYKNVYSWTSMVSGYMRVGQTDEARSLFDQMPEKNVVSWTTMVLGYARNGSIAEARKLFDQMPEKNVVSWTAMIQSYIQHNRIDDARKLFDAMPHRNLYSWNVMLLGYLDGHKLFEAVELFESMPVKNEISWTIMVTGIARNGSVQKAREMFNQVPIKDIAVYNAMITAYAHGGDIVEARQLFNTMPKRDLVTWNAMIDGYAKSGFSDQAWTLLINLLHACVRPDTTTLTGILTSSEIITEVTQVHALAILFGFDSDNTFTNALITAYSRSGDLGSAWLAFERLVDKDAVSWTAVILAFANHGHGTNALEAFSRMIRSGAWPDGITFVGVLSACSHAGLVDKGRWVFGSMSRAFGVKPSTEHYSCLVDLLGRAGRMEEAKQIVKEMAPSHRDVPLLASLLGACKLHGDVEVASWAGEELIGKEPDSSGGYMLLSNLYAAGGKWDEVARIRKRMKERKVRKVAAYSAIEVGKRSHVFYADDTKHPQCREIYAMLEVQLLPQMKDLGYDFPPACT